MASELAKAKCNATLPRGKRVGLLCPRGDAEPYLGWHPHCPSDLGVLFGGRRIDTGRPKLIKPARNGPLRPLLVEILGRASACDPGLIGIAGPRRNWMQSWSAFAQKMDSLEREAVQADQHHQMNLH